MAKRLRCKRGETLEWSPLSLVGAPRLLRPLPRWGLLIISPWQASELGECPGAPQPLPRPPWVTGSGCPHEGRARPARGHRKHAIVPNALCLPKMTFAQNDLSALTRDGSNPTVSLLLELCKSPGQCWHQLKGSHTRPSSLVELPLTATR